MANIYSEQGITETPVAKIGEMSMGGEARQAAKMFDAIEDNLQKKAEEHQKLATELYENGSNIAIHQGLNEIMRNPKFATNPEAFAQEADKMAGKIFGEIQNPEIKQRVMMNYELKKNPYLNRVYDNLYKQQNEQLEYQTLTGIQDDMDSMGVSIENVMAGTMGTDDLMFLSNAKNQFDKYVNTKDARGFDLFTPMQKMQLERQYNRNILDRLKGGYTQLPLQDQQKIAETLKNDGFDVKYNDKDGIFTHYDIKDMLPKDSYLDFKDFVLKTNARASKIAGGSGKVTKEIQGFAADQVLNQMENEKEWKRIGHESNIEGVTYYPNATELDVLAYRQKLQDQIYQGKISEKHFNDMMQKTVPVMEYLLENKGAERLSDSGMFSRATAIQGAIGRIKGELKPLEPRQQMFLVDTIYNQLAHEGLLDKSYSGDSETQSKINRIADNAVKVWLENQIPGLPDQKADKVLLRGHFYNYIPNPNPVYSKQVYDKTRALFVRDGIKYYDFTAPNGITYSKRIIDG